jgi:hypothetical protein
VFVTWLTDPKAHQPVLDPGAPAQASLSITAVRRPGSLFGSAPERASPPNSPPHGPKASATLMFRGPSWAGSLPRGLVSLGGKPPSYKEAPTLPAPLADWSENPSAASSPRKAVQLRTSFHRLPAEIGPSVTRRIFLPLPAIRGGGDFRPDHELNLHKESESRQAENEGSSLWITGISRISRDLRAGNRPIVASRRAK